MTAFLPLLNLSAYTDIGIALSGGPDSMCLTHALCHYIKEHKLIINVHALTVNHNLRDDSRQEAEDITNWVKNYPHLQHHILDWQTPETKSRIMETARTARYALMEEYCRKHSIKVLFIAHHQDDQVETFLFRLSKGSGLDGLCGMRHEYQYSPHLKIYRPLLEHSKHDLISYCEKHNIPFVNDPSNEKTKYARPRLRKSREVLEEEGLTPKRIATTARRLNRAKDALQWLSEKAVRESCEVRRDVVKINLTKLAEYPHDTHIRVLQSAISFLTPEHDYAPRMEKIEDIAIEAFQDKAFRKRTFAKLIFEKVLQDGNFLLLLSKET